MSLRIILALGSLNSIRNSACRFTWNPTIQINVIWAPFENEPANDCAEQDHISDDGWTLGFFLPLAGGQERPGINFLYCLNRPNGAIFSQH